MAINYNVWGLPETWVNGTSSEQNANIKYPDADIDTYREQWVANRIPLNTIDLSQFYYGIGKGSIVNKPYYLYPFLNGAENDVGYKPLAENKDRACIITATTSNLLSYNMRYTPARDTVVTTAVSPYTAKVMMDFNYQKVMLIPWVRVKAEGYTTNNYAFSLYDYIENERYNTYPHITNIMYSVRYGEGGETNRTSEESGFNFVCDFDATPYTATYNNLYFYGKTGFKILLGGHSTNSKMTIGALFTRYDDVINSDINSDYLGFASKYCKNESTSVQFTSFDPDRDDIWSINKTCVRSGVTKWYPYTYIYCSAARADLVKEYVLEQIAFLGLPFVYDPSNATLGQIGDLGVYLPVFDEYGVTTVEYKEGDQAILLPNAQWSDSRSAGYDPNRLSETGDTGYLYNGHHEGNRFSTYGTRKYALYLSDVWDVIDGINNLYLTDPDGNAKWQLDFKGSNPSDYIVGFYAFPLKIPHSENTQTFKLGPVDFDGVNVYTYSGTGSFSFGVINVPAKNNFLDFPPYTTAELYIPLCGSVDIDYPYFAGLQMEIYMYYDINTGSCSASIYRIANGEYLLYKTVNGQLGVEIPLTSLKMGNYQDSIHSIQAAQKQNEIRLAGSALSVAAGAAALIAAPATGGTSLIAAAGVLGGLGTLASGIEKEKELDYQLSHTQPNVSQVSAAETQNNYCVGGLYPVLYIKRCRMIDGSSIDTYDNTDYGKTIGFACCKCDTLDNFSGLTVCSSVDTSGISNEISTGVYISPTADEVNMIKSAFSNGVIL